MSKPHGIPWLNKWPDRKGYTWNPGIWGCFPESAGCANCYAATMAQRLAGMGQENYAKVVDGGRWNGEVVIDRDRIAEIDKWGKPRVVFVCSMCDPFHPKVPDSFLMKLLGVMAAHPQHVFILLAKRAVRMEVIWNDFYHYGLPRNQNLPQNIIQGVTVEDQDQQYRLAYLSRVPVKKLVSIEPMLGPLDLSPWIDELDWVICGCESGPGARAMDIEWAGNLAGQCCVADKPFFFKQAMVDGQLVKMPKLDGRIWGGLPGVAA